MLQADHHIIRNTQLFDTVAHTYDHIGFLSTAAQHTASAIDVRPGDTVLDVATGTGEIAKSLFERMGGIGRMFGTDISEVMISVAQHKCPTAFFSVNEATDLPFDNESFDWVVCGAGLFFMPDMSAAIEEWKRLLKPGGHIVFTAFAQGLLGPLPELWRNHLDEYGLKPSGPPLHRIGTPYTAYELLTQAELHNVQANTKRLSYSYANPTARWEEILSGLEGTVLHKLHPKQIAQIQAEHFEKLDHLFKDEPLTVSLPLIIASGQKPIK